MKFDEINIKEIGQEVLLVGGVWGGADKAYFFCFPEFCPPYWDHVTIVQMTPDDWKKLLRQSDLVETEVLEKAEDGKLYKAIARKCERTIDQATSWRVWRRDGVRCRYCGNDEVPLTVDHVVLWEEGGPSIEENLVSACRRCNKTRGNMQYADWLVSDYYQRVSVNLTPEEDRLNHSLLGTLSRIPRTLHQRSRGKKKKR
jgi:hypothetical protein